MTDQDDRGQVVLDTLTEIEAPMDGKQLAAVCRVKALWHLHCCLIAVFAGEEQEPQVHQGGGHQGGISSLLSHIPETLLRARTRLALQLNLMYVGAPDLSKACERIENESRGEYETEHHSNNLRCAPFTHYGRYYPAHACGPEVAETTYLRF
jgi:hypothetical protein